MHVQSRQFLKEKSDQGFTILLLRLAFEHKIEIGMYIYTQDSNQSDCTSSQSDQSLSFPTEETLDPLLPIECTSYTLTRGCGCAG